MKSLCRLIMLGFFPICIFLINLNSVYAFGTSVYESHHIFPQRYFGHLGDDSCFQLTEYEHRWIEMSGGYKNDWEKYDGFTVSFKNDEGITNYGVRCAALIAGSRILSYHLFTVNHNMSIGNGAREISGLLAAKLDIWSNLMYNISYIVGTPGKLIHFWMYALPKHTGFYGDPTVAELIIWSLKEAILGIIQAIIMLFVGSLIGLIMNPLWSLGGLLFSLTTPIRVNLFSTILWLVGAILIPITQIFFWS